LRTGLKKLHCLLLAALLAAAGLGCAESGQREAEGEYAEYQPNLAGSVSVEELEDEVAAAQLSGALKVYDKVDEAVVQVNGLSEGGKVSVAARLTLPPGESLSPEEQEIIMSVILSAVPGISEEDVELSWE